MNPKAFDFHHDQRNVRLLKSKVFKNIEHVIVGRIIQGFLMKASDHALIIGFYFG